MNATPSTYFAIKHLDSGAYWTGKAWGKLHQAKEWKSNAKALEHAKTLVTTLPLGSKVAVVQTV